MRCRVSWRACYRYGARVLISTFECACYDECGDFTSMGPDQMKLHPNQPVAQVAVVNGHQKVTGT